MVELSIPIPILGGIVSGFVGGIAGGVLSVEYRSRREKQIEKREWYDEIVRLANQIEAVTPDEYLQVGSGSKSGAEEITGFDRKHMETIYEEIFPVLNDRLSNAPSGVDQEVVSIGNRTVKNCRKVIQTIETSNTYLGIVSDAVEDARRLEKEAESAKEQLSWI